jgi:hypothetical protein
MSDMGSGLVKQSRPSCQRRLALAAIMDARNECGHDKGVESGAWNGM